MAEHVNLDQRVIAALAAILKQGSVKKTFSVRPISNYTRIENHAIMKEETLKGEKVMRYKGFAPVEVKYPEAFEVTFPARSKADNPNVIVCTAEELAHFKLNRDGGLVDMDTGEELSIGSNIIQLPISKSA